MTPPVAAAEEEVDTLVEDDAARVLEDAGADVFKVAALVDCDAMAVDEVDASS